MGKVIEFKREGGKGKGKGKKGKKGKEGGKEGGKVNNNNNNNECRKCQKIVGWDDWGVAIDNRKRRSKWESGLLVCPYCDEYQDETIITRISSISDEGVILNIPFDLLREIEYTDDQKLDIHALLSTSADILCHRKFKKRMQEYIDDE